MEGKGRMALHHQWYQQMLLCCCLLCICGLLVFLFNFFSRHSQIMHIRSIYSTFHPILFESSLLQDDFQGKGFSSFLQWMYFYESTHIVYVYYNFVDYTRIQWKAEKMLCYINNNNCSKNNKHAQIVYKHSRVKTAFAREGESYFFRPLCKHFFHLLCVVNV